MTSDDCRDFAMTMNAHRHLVALRRQYHSPHIAEVEIGLAVSLHTSKIEPTSFIYKDAMLQIA